MAEEITKISAKARFKTRSDTFENWELKNPTLLAGEPGVVTDGSDTEKIKFGDGVTPWNKLGWWKGPKGEPGEKGDTGPQGEKGETGPAGKDAVTDQTYNPESENAQSGVAVAEALNNYYTKEEIDTQIGDIETALDNIIAIQNELIGGDSE